MAELTDRAGRHVHHVDALILFVAGDRGLGRHGRNAHERDRSGVGRPRRDRDVVDLRQRRAVGAVERIGDRGRLARSVVRRQEDRAHARPYCRRTPEWGRDQEHEEESASASEPRGHVMRNAVARRSLRALPIVAVSKESAPHLLTRHALPRAQRVSE